MGGSVVSLSIIILNWNGGPVLLDCLASIYEHPASLPFEVIVVDNASTDGSPEQAAARFGQVRLLRNKRNLGFAAGNNRGMAIARGRYFLLLNNDALVLDGALDALIAEAQAYPEAGIIGPKLINPDGTLQRSCGIFPSLLTELLDQTMLHRLFPLYKMRYRAYQAPREVDWVTGACMLVRRELYEQIGGLDEGFHMFLEDVDWCLRARRAGWVVRYTPKATVVHLKGYSSRSVLPDMLVEDQRSVFRFFRKHYSRHRVWALRFIVSAGCVVRGMFWALQALISRRELAAARLRAYGGILRRTWTDRAFVWGERNDAGDH